MKTGILCNKPLETALKGAGFKVDGIERKGKKTVITVERVIKGVALLGFNTPPLWANLDP